MTVTVTLEMTDAAFKEAMAWISKHWGDGVTAVYVAGESEGGENGTVKIGMGKTTGTGNYIVYD